MFSKSGEDVLENPSHIKPENVHETIRKHMLADGFDFVLDMKNSKGVHLVDEKTGKTYFDFFTFFASSPLGLNHPKLHSDSVKKELLESTINKPSNSDIYTVAMAEFVETFARVAKPDYMKYLFFISGGALAVENALKVAFDWKVQKNFAKGHTEEKGHKIIHFRQAFHGRSGYTLSLTNTDPVKIKYFPKFDWPRIINPKIKFPVEENLPEIISIENQAIEEIQKAIDKYPDDVAAIIIEPIQGEGGDNFFRKEFFVKLREISDENEILLIFDEVQCGFGLTGKFWAHEYYVKPDIVAFGKKAQVCGILVSDRINDVKGHCFRKSSRINSTWGSDLTDMVRSKHILRIIEEDNLIDNAARSGEHLLNGLFKLQTEFPELITNVRGLGLMCSFDLPTSKVRDEFRNECIKNNLIILGCGEKSIRFRPPLNITTDELDEGLNLVRKVLIFYRTKN
ncbi:MAG: L-lysine 6-transaminase [Ignavibacteriales bacterium]|nr:MAG: L-lysine 6-transaminase [Ignavibacteriales bacterium]